MPACGRLAGVVCVGSLAPAAHTPLLLASCALGGMCWQLCREVGMLQCFYLPWCGSVALTSPLVFVGLLWGRVASAAREIPSHRTLSSPTPTPPPPTTHPPTTTTHLAHPSHRPQAELYAEKLAVLNKFEVPPGTQFRLMLGTVNELFLAAVRVIRATEPELAVAHRAFDKHRLSKEVRKGGVCDRGACGVGPPVPALARPNDHPPTAWRGPHGWA